MNIRIGTRRSNLARYQAKAVAEALQAKFPHVSTSLVLLSSSGDKDRRSTLGQIGGVGAFTKESEDALLRGEADLVVHSLKDLPTTLMEGLLLAAVPARHDPRDVLCGLELADLSAGVRIGTGSIRRRGQLLRLHPDLEIRPIRGNVPPRLRKAANKEGIDGTILALAGLERLELLGEAGVFDILDPDVFPYAVGQGALGVEARQTDRRLVEMLAELDDPESRAQVDAERSLMKALEAGCSLPVGVHTRTDSNQLSLKALVTSVDGKAHIWAERSGALTDAEEIGRALAVELKALGAEPLLLEATLWRTERDHPAA